MFFVAKKDKVIAYALGHGDVSYSGYIPCHRSKETEEADFSTSCLNNKLCCGVFVTEYHAYLLIADTQHSKMLYEDILLEEDQPNLLDVFRFFGAYKNAITPEVKDHVEEEE